VVLKLNGGLGTSMGLDKAKSLLKVKGNNTFLDLTAKQVISMRKEFGLNVKFMLMNSFNTSKDTLSFLSKYPTIIGDPHLELMQNKVPKVDAKTFLPVEWSANRHLEWCPPGHGDLYSALYGSGKLDALLAEGVKYMFVSNSDNLGATLDLDLLTYFAQSNMPFMMECCRRTEADKKGGHLALRTSDQQFILRESAQCAKEDEDTFQKIFVHKYFNTNNLWVRLDLLKDLMDARGGFVPLPTIQNPKTVDPQIDTSTPVIQLETAMGAAIECFQGAGAVCVSRTRFAPVKKCSDLFLLRSNAYVINKENVLVLNDECGPDGVAPIVDLDSKKFKLVQSLEAAVEGGIYPSLYHCKKLKISGEVYLSGRNIFRGNVTIINSSKEPKVLPGGIYENTTVDLSSSPGLGPLRVCHVGTVPFDDQKPGTSGLRKKTKRFQEGLYLHNFVQAVFNSLQNDNVTAENIVDGGALLIGGDGRYFNDIAVQVIIKIAIANGVKRIIIGQNGLLSTPAISAIIRERGPRWQQCFGSFILTASHNPGGPLEDFGIKYNCENGGPAPEALTDEIYEITKSISTVKMCVEFPHINIETVGTTIVPSGDGSKEVLVEVISSTEHHATLLETIFDFPKISQLFSRPDFSMVYDCMHGVQGPYAREIFVNMLGAPDSCLLNAIPKDDFNGGHADPNLTYARDICDIMHIDRQGLVIPSDQPAKIPCFGAAADGDADRNMILGRQFFVTPSDSLAIIAAHADTIPFFSLQGGLKSVARSMPTSGAVDLVAKRLNLNLFEVPTGWKFFGNIMDSKVSPLSSSSYCCPSQRSPLLFLCVPLTCLPCSLSLSLCSQDIYHGQNFNPTICGEESFGTGSNHIREKDGMWAVLAWLSILAHYNSDPSVPSPVSLLLCPIS
jgi:phosphoglucomutase